ncbi:MAG: hypothetical protein J6Q95_00865 [Alistipes sp.]|nr:hypothetical protein [Alistipes sp.]
MGYFEKYTTEQLRTLITQYPWWSAARMELLRRKLQNTDPDKRANVITAEGDEAALLARLHPTSIIPLRDIDIARLTHLTTDDLIDRFLKLDDYRIVAEEGSAEDLSQVEIDEDEEMVSEELAEIYLKQGLYDDAIDTYRKLSLLNSEKSIYFAELIAKIEDSKTK